MDANNFKEYLEKRYFDQMNFYKKASTNYQNKYRRIQWVLIILSTLTTIMAALPNEFNLKYAIVISAAIVTVLTSALKTFQYQELWVNYRSTREQLKPELYFYQFNIGDYGQPGIDKEALFVSNVESILNKEREGWVVTKKAKEQDDSQNNDLQKKLDDLIKEKFKDYQSTITVTKTEIETQPADDISESENTDAGEEASDDTLHDESSGETEQTNAESTATGQMNDDGKENSVATETSDNSETAKDAKQSNTQNDNSNEQNTVDKIEITAIKATVHRRYRRGIKLKPVSEQVNTENTNSTDYSSDGKKEETAENTINKTSDENVKPENDETVIN